MARRPFNSPGGIARELDYHGDDGTKLPFDIPRRHLNRQNPGADLKIPLGMSNVSLTGTQVCPIKKRVADIDQVVSTESGSLSHRQGFRAGNSHHFARRHPKPPRTGGCRHENAVAGPARGLEPLSGREKSRRESSERIQVLSPALGREPHGHPRDSGCLKSSELFT